jgi:NAD(P)-dependent dehydrogenase (short-subunit alcohol dehydrogenase family)
LPNGHTLLIVGDVPEVSAAIEIVLTAEDYRVRQLISGSSTRIVSENVVEADFSSAESLREAHRLVLGSAADPIGAIVNLLALEAQFRHHHRTSADEAAALRLAQNTSNVIKQFEDDLRRSAAQGGGWLINFTSLNGKFGVDSEIPFPLAQAGTLGVMKSAAKEIPGIRVKNIDLDSQVEPQVLFASITAELAADAPEIEVGFNAAGRWTLELREQLATESEEALALDRESVVLVTGGAHGITAEVCKALARDYSPRLILVGRSPLPADEPAALRELASTTALRQYLIATMRRTDASVTPAQIEQALRQILKSRQMRANLAELRRLGSSVEYHALDVRDAASFSQLLDDVYARIGRIDGVIHGAGVIDDRMIRDKTPESFARVFTTKVNSAMTLTRKLRPESLKFLIFFSSISGRFGNIGQADYSAANEYLNKLAQQLDQSWPGRVVAINWGPWDAGMVSDQLREIYHQKDIDLIPPAEGVRFFMSELVHRGPSAPEVVITCSARQIEQISLKR